MEKDGQTVTSHEIWYPGEVSCSCRIEDSLLFLFLLFFFFFMLWWLNCDGRQIRRIKGSYCFDLCMREREREGVVWFRWGSEKDILKWIYTHTQSYREEWSNSNREEWCFCSLQEDVGDCFEFLFQGVGLVGTISLFSIRTFGRLFVFPGHS